LIFVYTPEFIDGQKFMSNRDEIIDLYKIISNKYSIKFYDYSQDSICLNKKYFYNSMHLNKFGSEIFSRNLACALQKR